MRKFKYLILLIFLNIFAFGINEDYLGTQALYKVEDFKYTAPPKGYKPFYINHLGRHGARYLSSSKNLDYLLQTLNQAGQINGLTEEGIKLKEKLEIIKKAEEGRYGLLTPLGIEMEVGIGARMYQHFPEVFGKKIKAEATYVKRTQESMEAFLKGLGQYTSWKNFETSINGKVDPYLRFFDLNKKYLEYKKKGAWIRKLEKYDRRENIWKNIAKKFFKESYLKEYSKAYTFISSLYKIYGNQFDAGIPDYLGEYFSEGDKIYFWENGNAEQFMEKGPGLIGTTLPTNIAFGLLHNFLETSSSAIEQQNISANLRFAHAETIIPFASILGISWASQHADNINQIKNIWQDYKVAPMGANIQWIFYSHPEKEEILVKMLYNELEIKFPLESELAPYYSWDEVKNYYENFLKGLDINFKESMTTLVEDYK
jgi:hypothetical protein